MEVWTLKQAALLLHGMDPHKYRSLKPYVNNLPPEYADLQKTYFVLHQFPWEETYSDYYYRGKGIHPVAIVHLAITQKLPLPKRLKKWVAERFHQKHRVKRMREIFPVLLRLMYRLLILSTATNDYPKKFWVYRSRTEEFAQMIGHLGFAPV